MEKFEGKERAERFRELKLASHICVTPDPCVRARSQISQTSFICILITHWNFL